ncbi:MAG TPA: transposase, partial [Desulfosporosinus sp.]|nr:transposase [Desulfosporosinus sp.]
YYLQLVLEGFPPVKINKNGEFRHKAGSSKVGIDIGPQTAGISSNEKVSLLELAPEINTPYREIRKLQRRLDRSRRANNPNKFNANGTFKRSNKDRWVKSKHYQKDQYKLQRIQGKLKNIRKQSHNRLANEIISHGTEVNVETMSFNGLQKRAKKTTKNKKGKINSKKRFGKSLANKAPAMFLTILDNKLRHQGTELHRIKTAEVKASQYNHMEDNYTKKELNERWTMIGEDKIQRDLYSSFLIMNVNPDLSSINRKQCLEKYEKFKTLHDIEIERLKTSTNRKIASMGI